MRIIFCGDLVLQDPQNTYIGSHLTELLKSADIRAVNFEAPVYCENISPIHKSGPNLTQSNQSPWWLQKYDFNLISLANNHILDYDVTAFNNTTSAFKEAVLLGAGTVEEAYKPLIIESNGLKIGFIAGTQKEFGCHNEMSSYKNDIGTAWLGAKQFRQLILNTKRECDILFLLAHAGIENIDTPLPQWREFYKETIDLGVDCVIGSHPHTPQGVEYYCKKPIFYSLGNFVFQTPNTSVPENWNKGIIAVIDIDSTGMTRTEIIPVRYDVISKTIDIDNSSDRIKHIEYLNKLLIDDNLYKHDLRMSLDKLIPLYKWSLSCSGYYKPQLSLSYIKQVAKTILGRTPDNIHFYNLFNCESHRWVMEYMIQNKLL